jgi:hypothetical protein
MGEAPSDWAGWRKMSSSTESQQVLKPGDVIEVMVKKLDHAWSMCN